MSYPRRMPSGFAGPFDGMQIQRELLRHLEANDVTSAMLWDLIESHDAEAKKARRLDLRYRLDAKGVPIKTRTLDNPRKVNHKLNNDFFGRIVRTKVGYLATDVSVVVDAERATNRTRTISDHVASWNRANAMSTKATELARYATMCGRGFSLLFVPRTGANGQRPQPRTMVVPPWEAIVVRDPATDDVVFAMRYFEIEQVTFGELRDRPVAGSKPSADHPSPDGRRRSTTARMVVEWYDATTVSYYLEDDPPDASTRGELRLDPTRAPGGDGLPPGMQLHLFDGVPLIEWPNNDERIGDAEIPLALIDAYDIAASDLASEITQLRLAYMIVKGMGKEIDTKFLQQLEQTGVFTVDADGDVRFLEKALNDEAVENLLALLKRNIFLFANSVDFTDEQFKANLPIVAFMLALKPLEESAMATELQWVESLRTQYRLLTGWWAEFGGFAFDPELLDYVFTRNVPANASEEIEQFIALGGKLSQRTALSRLTFVDDVDAELERIEGEREQAAERFDAGGMIGGQAQDGSNGTGGDPAALAAGQNASNGGPGDS